MNALLKFACLLLAVVLLSSQVQALCTCKSASAPIGRCTADLRVCGCLKGLKWRYEARASEASTGASGAASWFKSGQGAAEAAVENMFQNHPELQVKCFASVSDFSVNALSWSEAELNNQ